MDASLAEEFGRLAIELHGRRSLDETIDQVVQYALTAVDCDFADVMFLHREKRIETVAATVPWRRRRPNCRRTWTRVRC